MTTSLQLFTASPPSPRIDFSKTRVTIFSIASDDRTLEVSSNLDTSLLRRSESLAGVKPPECFGPVRLTDFDSGTRTVTNVNVKLLEFRE